MLRASPGPGDALGDRAEHLGTQILRAMPVGHREHHFHPIAGGKINELSRTQRRAQRREAPGYVVFGKGEPGDLIRAGVAIRKAHDADLVHGADDSMSAGFVCHRMVIGWL